MINKIIVCWVLFFVIILDIGCSTSVQNIKSDKSPNIDINNDKKIKTFGITPDNFRKEMNARMEKETREALYPFQTFNIQNNHFKVDRISKENIILEGTIASNGELTSLTYTSRMVDDESLIKTMSLIDLTAKILPPSMDEKKKGDLLEDVIEASVASPKSFAQKLVNNSVVYTVESLPDGQFIVRYTPATIS
ncbi:hypothetical protein [Acinetobacter nectaris]|uniref:hypothetical protein n=1 Tax=Acinetobacter nectaris TaxID=1219382 RepID=UPI001F1D053E|nr:hypothetical protein [Acinetobacter nectaris]MCF9033679.1 hypothetical protein [Acinetobacter nectaris]